MGIKLRDQIDTEIKAALAARQAGSEGKARVCARRAAGLAVRHYFSQGDSSREGEPGMDLEPGSVYDALKTLAGLPGLKKETREAARSLVLRVDEDFNLPEEVDLLEAARLVVEYCMEEKPEIVLYGTNWCGRSRRCRLILDENAIPHRYVDIDQDEQAAQLVERMNHGFRSVPTIVWPDGTHLTEPSDMQLLTKLGLKTS